MVERTPDEAVVKSIAEPRSASATPTTVPAVRAARSGRPSRSDALLRAAVVQLAQQKPAATINVSELCRAAHITRDTFYRYAPSPIALLARVLDDDLTTYATLADDPLDPGSPGGTVMDAPSRAWLGHVCRYEAVYRRSLHPRLPTELRDVLFTRIEHFMRSHALRHPDILPPTVTDLGQDRGIQMAAAQVAAGAVGAIESWLATGPIGDLAIPMELLHSFTAPWWFQVPASQR